MFKKKKTYVIIISILLVAGGFFYFKNKKPKVEYTTAEAQKGTLAQTVSVTGITASQHEVELSFKTSGIIQELYVDIGDRVKKGQKVAVIDKGTLYAQLKQAKEEVMVQKQTLANMKRKGSAYKVEQKYAQRAVIRKAEAAVTQIYAQFADTVLYSPMDGIIIRRNGEVGETITANSAASNTPVVTVAQEGDLDVKADVPESDIVKIALGQKADITLDAFTSQDVFEGEVIDIEPASTIIQDVVYYKVKFKILNYDQRIKNGMSADLDIKTNSKNNVVSVPERAIKEENGKKYVEILKDAKTNTIEKVYVTTGLRGNDGMMEIASGLTGGEKVVTLTKK
ncbi:MAG TPA: efflux RND transporter periplasmic adaptor subunit [Candidatus Moranbacteria bacterium]|nr:efflux RND transporter periplasmic adaptor subunit [Candidatus Moranbacteria bacterium]